MVYSLASEMISEPLVCLAELYPNPLTHMGVLVYAQFYESVLALPFSATCYAGMVLSLMSLVFTLSMATAFCSCILVS